MAKANRIFHRLGRAVASMGVLRRVANDEDLILNWIDDDHPWTQTPSMKNFNRTNHTLGRLKAIAICW
jgi:hypothetical protein